MGKVAVVYLNSDVVTRELLTRLSCFCSFHRSLSLSGFFLFNQFYFSHVQRDSIQYIKGNKHLYNKGGLKRIRIDLFGLV